MKILVLENEPSSRRGGQECSLLGVCTGLAQRGHEIHLVYREDGDFLPKYQQFCKSITKVRRYVIDTTGKRHLIVSSVSWLGSLLPVLKIDADVVYINQTKEAFFGGSVARLKQVPLVCHLRLFPPKTFLPQIRWGLQYVTRFITVSQATLQGYLRAGFDPKTLRVVYNGIDLKRFSIQGDRQQTRQQLNLPPNAFVVVYAGRIDRPKNIEMLIRAFAQLGLPPEQARLMLVGSPVVHASPQAAEAYVQELKDLCSQLNISNHVHWLGRRTDLPEIFRAADVSVLPSLLPDTFGLVLAESMACGTPALGLRFGGIPDVLSDEFEKFQIAVGDVAGLSDRLESLRNWQETDPNLGQRCRAYVEKRFPVERVVTEVEAALQEAVELGPVRLGPSQESLEAWENEVITNPTALAGLVTQ
uniref:glycosyltransferase family 4 protein n=1 Tax=Trichocoleus desertorum TaxID=1481672 RepID=UPI0025B31B69|nr:glycosyltransferase family 4 protein [Trichocoleus desertorum]